MTVIIVLLAVIAILAILALVNRRMAAKAMEGIEPPGDLIEVRPGEYLHGLSMGEGKYTMVMLSGMGTPCPCADFYPLAKAISKHCRVIILELPGYGFASLTDAPRTMENYEKEIKTGLDYYGLKENVILMPHSYTGVMTFDYAKKHPDVVCALFNDDASTGFQCKLPRNESFALKILIFLMRHYAAFILRRNIAEETKGLPPEYVRYTKAITYNRYYNKVVASESDAFPALCAEIEGQKYDEALHVINMLGLADKTEKREEYFKKHIGMNWRETHEALISNPAIQSCVVIPGAVHYIHHGHVPEMEKLAVELLEQLG